MQCHAIFVITTLWHQEKSRCCKPDRLGSGCKYIPCNRPEPSWGMYFNRDVRKLVSNISSSEQYAFVIQTKVSVNCKARASSVSDTNVYV
jgi:hypothetical protein